MILSSPVVKLGVAPYLSRESWPSGMRLFAFVEEGKSYGIFGEAWLEFNESPHECQELGGRDCIPSVVWLLSAALSPGFSSQDSGFLYVKSEIATSRLSKKSPNGGTDILVC
jgi:hypothetical protein